MGFTSKMFVVSSPISDVKTSNHDYKTLFKTARQCQQHQMVVLRRNKHPQISLYASHYHIMKPRHKATTTTTTTTCILKEERDSSPSFTSCGLKFIRGKKLLSELSTWRIGGPCNYFVQVSDRTQLLSAIRYCREHSIRFLIIGKGSNCLFDDSGFDGCIILNRIDFFEEVKSGIYRVGSGYPFNQLGVRCSNDGFTGLEFASGVPGSVGGGAYMNAGANGQEISDVISSVEILQTDGRLETINQNDLAFSYRKSSFQDMEDLAAIVAVTFKIKPFPLAREQQKAYLTKRRLSQPLGERSAGSVFKNPEGVGVSAGELIEKAGLKGFRLGNAKISEVHANFFINCGGSTSKDMIELINLVKEKVKDKFNVELIEEIQYVSPI
ncbi:hypothetical protein C5167_003471 [Papaver somniferum]|uniref:UDP-N-acetylmuramate dehydrogenase n=1 Tax=Papaver somniferum TaxID=3469 RepID=A0A4Y7L3R1_PAPSO|nr:uncharacterized protein LOC113308207 isoform X2 [Papaver somniferum]RZC79282.1 hypothetical protein C5167_003471 [Papaver somniferum]